MVVVKCTSALAVTRTRSNTGLLNAEDSPTDPFIVVPAMLIEGCSKEENDETDTDAEGFCAIFGRAVAAAPCAGAVLATLAMILDGRRRMFGAFAAFCRTETA